MRLAGGVPEHGAALRGHRRHQRVLGPGDAGLVEEDVGPDRALLGLELVAVADGHRGAQLLEGQEVGVDPAAADDVTAGRRQGHACRSARAAGPPAGSRRGSGRRARDRAASAARRARRRGPVGPGPLDRGAEIDEEREHASRRRGCGGCCRAPSGRRRGRVAARIGSAAFLLPAGRIGAAQRAAAADEKTWRHGQS